MPKSLLMIKKSIHMAAIATCLLVVATPVYSSTLSENGSSENRVIYLKGTTNTRDIGAYLTALGVDQEARRALAASLTTEQPKLAMVE